MNSSKSTLWLLLTAVLVIWSLVVWRFNSLQTESPKPKRPQIRQALNKQELSTDKLVYKFNYADPFLKTGHSTQTSSSKTPPKRQAKTQVKPSNSAIKRGIKKWPKVSYIGHLKSPAGPSYFIEVNGEQRAYELGDSLYGMHLTFAHTDSVRLMWQGQEQVFHTKQ